MKKITRRQFLTSAGATSAALLLSSLPHAAAADENCLRKVTPAATNSNDLSWDMAEEILTHISRIPCLHGQCSGLRRRPQRR